MDILPQTVPAAILISSFLGSWHCAAMCGPIASIMRDRRRLFLYNLGRLISYSVLGLLGGFLGSKILSPLSLQLRALATVFFALIIIIIGMSNLTTWQKKTPFFEKYMLKLSHKFFPTSPVSHSSFLVGLLTLFLPCGWLYSYVTAAIATKNPWAGLFVMQLFWLGGLPAVNTLSIVIHKNLKNKNIKIQTYVGIVLILSGIYSLVSFFVST